MHHFEVRRIGKRRFRVPFIPDALISGAAVAAVVLATLQYPAQAQENAAAAGGIGYATITTERRGLFDPPCLVDEIDGQSPANTLPMFLRRLYAWGGDKTFPIHAGYHEITLFCEQPGWRIHAHVRVTLAAGRTYQFTGTHPITLQDVTGTVMHEMPLCTVSESDSNAANPAAPRRSLIAPACGSISAPSANANPLPDPSTSYEQSALPGSSMSYGQYLKQHPADSRDDDVSN